MKKIIEKSVSAGAATMKELTKEVHAAPYNALRKPLIARSHQSPRRNDWARQFLWVVLGLRQTNQGSRTLETRQ